MVDEKNVFFLDNCFVVVISCDLSFLVCINKLFLLRWLKVIRFFVFGRVFLKFIFYFVVFSMDDGVIWG